MFFFEIVHKFLNELFENLLFFLKDFVVERVDRNC